MKNERSDNSDFIVHYKLEELSKHTPVEILPNPLLMGQVEQPIDQEEQNQNNSYMNKGFSEEINNSSPTEQEGQINHSDHL